MIDMLITVFQYDPCVICITAALEGLCSASVIMMSPVAEKSDLRRNLSFSVKRGRAAVDDHKHRTTLVQRKQTLLISKSINSYHTVHVRVHPIQGSVTNMNIFSIKLYVILLNVH